MIRKYSTKGSSPLVLLVRICDNNSRPMDSMKVEFKFSKIKLSSLGVRFSKLTTTTFNYSCGWLVGLLGCLAFIHNNNVKVKGNIHLHLTQSQYELSKQCSIM
jgi:hypothetical protein